MNENKYHHNINLSIHIRYNLVTEFIGPNKTIGERSVLIHCQRLIVLVLFFQATKGKGRGQGEKKWVLQGSRATRYHREAQCKGILLT